MHAQYNRHAIQSCVRVCFVLGFERFHFPTKQLNLYFISLFSTPNFNNAFLCFENSHVYMADSVLLIYYACVACLIHLKARNNAPKSEYMCACVCCVIVYK